MLGLYIVGRPDPEIRQLENAIVAEKKTQRLRIVSATSLLTMAEMMATYDVSHEDVLALLRPAAPPIDPLVDLMSRLVAGRKGENEPQLEPQSGPGLTPPKEEPSATNKADEVVYWLTPVKSTKDETAEQCIQKLVGKERIYAFGENTPGRKRIKPNDWVAFYANGKGVVAHARVASVPEKKPHRAVHDSSRYPWVFKVADAKLYIDKPVVIDVELRSRLEAFKERDPSKPWAWFVQGTGTIGKGDFEILTNSAG